MNQRVAASAELLSTMIRNACVNDGSADSGQEVRNADVLRAYLGADEDVQVFEPHPGRQSLLLRLQGTDAQLEPLALVGHTDVVPAGDDWDFDPFCGDLVDGEILGRGAIDMLSLTATMATSIRHVVDSGVRPRRTLLFLGVADEEAGGRYGSRWLMEHHPEHVDAGYVLTEAGGFPFRTERGICLEVFNAEKASIPCKLTVKGDAGHAAYPYGLTNALTLAATVLQRLSEIRTPAVITDAWRAYVDGMGFPADIARGLLDGDQVLQACSELSVGMAQHVHASTHMTVTPTVVRGGAKQNVMPSAVEITLDIRILPGQTPDEVASLLRVVVGDLGDRVTVAIKPGLQPMASPIETPLWDVLSRVAQRRYPGAQLVPSVSTSVTDARFFRAGGAIAYGFGLFSERFEPEEYFAMYHGRNERVDVESIGTLLDLWDGVIAEFAR